MYLNVYKQMTDVKLLHNNAWNLLCANKMNSGSVKKVINKMCLQILYI